MSKKTRRGTPRPRLVHQVLVILNDTDPLVWRRIQVPEGYSFWDLHVAIQDAMGWLDCHLHEYAIPWAQGIMRIGIPGEQMADEQQCMPDWEFSVSDHLTMQQPLALYTYDFGDDWRHTVVYEGAQPGEPFLQFPRCIGGANACPPEDVGGPHAFHEFKKLLAGQDSDMREWFGDLRGSDYDATRFDPAAVRFDDPKERWNTAFGPETERE